MDFTGCPYLEDQDFDSQGVLLTKHTVVLFFWKSCGHCRAIKPLFELACAKNSELFAVVEHDGERPSERALTARLTTVIPGFRGFPAICKYDNSGNLVAQWEGDRSASPENVTKFLEWSMS